MRAFLRLVVAGLVGIAAADEIYDSGCYDHTTDDDCTAAQGCVWYQDTGGYCGYTDTTAGGGGTGTGGDVSGCMDTSATNYDPSATLEDYNSCTYCYDHTTDTDCPAAQGCVWYQDDGGYCGYTDTTAGGGGTGTGGDVSGCMDTSATNYDPSATLEDYNSCTYCYDHTTDTDCPAAQGCVWYQDDGGYCGYTDTAAGGGGTGTGGDVSGCMDTSATNYDPSATLEDYNSCTYCYDHTTDTDCPAAQGCVWYQDDGGYCGYTDTTAGGGGTGTGGDVSGCMDTSATNYDPSATLEDYNSCTYCYDHTTDTDCPAAQGCVWYQDDGGYCGYTDTTAGGGGTGTGGDVSGCMDTSATNYDPSATLEDYNSCTYCYDHTTDTDCPAAQGCVWYQDDGGYCGYTDTAAGGGGTGTGGDVSGCMDTSATNYDPSATLEDYNSCTYCYDHTTDTDCPAAQGCVWYQDDGGYCGYTDTAAGGGGTGTGGDVSGCMDTSATNYDPSATLEDYNSCTYCYDHTTDTDCPAAQGCVWYQDDGGYCGYTDTAAGGGGTGTGGDVSGCMDTSATNYDPSATLEDYNSCTYCYDHTTDTDCPAAQGCVWYQDDGGYCGYTDTTAGGGGTGTGGDVSGCMDTSATNYDPSATLEDYNSCTYCYDHTTDDDCPAAQGCVWYQGDGGYGDGGYCDTDTAAGGGGTDCSAGMFQCADGTCVYDEYECSYEAEDFSVCPSAQQLTGNAFIQFNPAAFGENCLWVMTCSGDNVVPEINFQFFETELNFDYVFLYDGNSFDATERPDPGSFAGPVFHGNLFPAPSTQTATSSTAAVRYTSDGSVNGRGFSAFVDCVEVVPADDSCVSDNADYGANNGWCDYSSNESPLGTCSEDQHCCPLGTDCSDCGECGEVDGSKLTFDFPTIACNETHGRTVTGNESTIGFPSDSTYPPDARCLWVVNCSDPSANARVTFLNMAVEQGWDYIYVFDDVGNKQEAEIARNGGIWREQLSGVNPDLHQTYTGGGAQLAVYLTADNVVEAAGFQAVAECVAAVSDCARDDQCCRCREAEHSESSCAGVCAAQVEALVRDSCSGPVAACDAASECAPAISNSLADGRRPRRFSSPEAEEVWNCIEGLDAGCDDCGVVDYGHACSSHDDVGCELDTGCCGLDTLYACTTPCCECHTNCRSDPFQDDDFLCQAWCDLYECSRCGNPDDPDDPDATRYSCCECDLMCDGRRPDSRNGRVPSDSEQADYITCLSDCAVGSCYTQNWDECEAEADPDCCRAELDCQVECQHAPVAFACQNACLQREREATPGLCGNAVSLCQRCETQCEQDWYNFYCLDFTKYLGATTSGECDEHLCKQYCQCVQCAGEPDYDATSCEVCPLKQCTGTDVCDASTSQCLGKVVATVVITATSVEALESSPSFDYEFKNQVSIWLGVDPLMVIIDWEATRQSASSAGRRRRLQTVPISVQFSVLVPTEEAADQADVLATEALRARQTGETATIGGFAADTSTMAAAITWSQFINPYSTLRLATDRTQQGAEYCDGHPHVLPIGTEASPPGYVYQRYERSFLRLDAGSVAGATITLQTCNSETTVGASQGRPGNTVPAMTALTTFKPSYIEEQGGDVMLARNDQDIVVSQENFPDAPVACSIDAEELDDSVLSQIQSQICTCPAGSYTPAVLRETLEPRETLLRVECGSPEGCTNLEVMITCLRPVNCTDPTSISQQFAYGEWQNDNGELEALTSMATSTTADATQVVELVNTGVLVLEVEPPTGDDKPEWVTVDVVENNRPVAFTTFLSIAPGDRVQFMLTFSGSKKPEGASSADEMVFFATRGGVTEAECDDSVSHPPDRQGEQRAGLTLAVDLLTRKVALTAIAIPSVVEVQLTAGDARPTPITLYNVMTQWATWVVRGCATDDICEKVANGQCGGPSVPAWIEVQDFEDPETQETSSGSPMFNPDDVSWAADKLLGSTNGFACTNSDDAGCEFSGDQTAFAAEWRTKVQQDKCANVWPPVASSDTMTVLLNTEGATAPEADEYCGGEDDDFVPTCDRNPYTDRWLDSADCPEGCDAPTCDLIATTDGTADCPAGCAYDPAVPTCTGTPTACTGTANAVSRQCAFEEAYSPICDLDPWTDASGACPVGCDNAAAYTPTCDLDPATPPLGVACPDGCNHHRRAPETCTGTADVVAASCTGQATEIAKTCRAPPAGGSTTCIRYPATTKTHQAGTYYYQMNVLAGPYPRFGTEEPNTAWGGEEPSRTCSKPGGCTFGPGDVSWMNPMDEAVPDGCERDAAAPGGLHCDYGAPFLSNVEANSWSVGVTMVVVPQKPYLPKVTVGISHAALRTNQVFSGTVNLVDMYLNVITEASHASSFRIQCDACKWSAADVRNCVGTAVVPTCDRLPNTNPELGGECAEAASVSVQADADNCAAVTNLATSDDCLAVQLAADSTASACVYRPACAAGCSRGTGGSSVCTGTAHPPTCAYTNEREHEGCTVGCVDAPPSAKVKYGSYLTMSESGQSVTAVGFHATLTTKHGGDGYTGTPYQLKLLQKNPVCEGTADEPSGGGKAPACELAVDTDGNAIIPAVCPDGCTTSNSITTRDAYSPISDQSYSPACDLIFATDGTAACLVSQGCVFQEATADTPASCTDGATAVTPVTPDYTKNFTVNAVTCTGANLPNDCSDFTEAQIAEGRCVIGSKCVCQVGQGKANPAAPCELCAPGKYTDRRSDLPCMECPAGKVSNGTGTVVCVDCPAGKSSPESLPGGARCVDCLRNEYSSNSVLSGQKCVPCPAGTETVGPGYPVCNCKVDHYFDHVSLTGGQKEKFRSNLLEDGNVGRYPTWEDVGCVDCTKLLPTEMSHTYKCQGGPKGPEASMNAIAEAKAKAGTWTPVGPAIATEGWFLVARECDVGNEDDPDIKTCFTSHPCSGDACYGMLNVVAKEYNDMKDVDDIRYSDYPAGGFETPEFSPSNIPNRDKNATAWCKLMHQMALEVEKIPVDDLLISREDSETKAIVHSFMYEVDGCAEKYIAAITRAREYLGYGVRNFCHVGHQGERCASCSVVDGVQLEKGDDGLCHYCREYSLWQLTYGDLATCFLYQIPYNLFMRSGRPEALKSAMFASFMFFIQTVTLLGQDSGYFMGKADGAKEVAKVVEVVTRIFSVNLQASSTPVAMNNTVAREDICPGMIDTYFTNSGALSPFSMFFKQAIFKSVILLGGVTVWHHGVFWLFVNCRLQYYLGRLLYFISGKRCCRTIKWQWTTEVKVLYQDSVETRNKVTNKKESSFQPVMDKVVEGPGAVMLNFHTCGILLGQARDIQDGREQAIKVRARAKFKKADADHGGTLDKDELLALLADMGNKATEKDVEAVLKSVVTKRPDTSEASPDEMLEDEFVDWYLHQKFKAPRPFCGSKKYRCYHCGAFRPDPANFRPNGSVRGECVVSSVAGAGKLDSLLTGARLEDGPFSETNMGIPPHWFEGDEEAGVNTKKEFEDLFAAIIPMHSKGHKDILDDEVTELWSKLSESGHIETNAPIAKAPGTGLPVHAVEPAHHSRVRIDQLDPLGASSLLVSFTVLPEDYHHSMTSEGHRVKHLLDAAQPTYDPVKHHGLHKNDRCCRKKNEHIKRDARAGMDIRQNLQAAFTEKLVLGARKSKDEATQVPEGQRHDISGLSLEILVDLKDMQDGARFWRAVYMLSATVLYYPVIQATLPILQCYQYLTQRLWDTCVLNDDGECEAKWRTLDDEFLAKQTQLCKEVRGMGYDILAAKANSTWTDRGATAMSALSFVGHGVELGEDVDYDDTSQSCLFSLGECLEALDTREEDEWSDYVGFQDVVNKQHYDRCLERYAECQTCGDEDHGKYCVWDEGLVWLGTPQGQCLFGYDVKFLDAEQSTTCTGQQWWISTVLAYIILGCCILFPIAAFFKIKESKHAAKDLAIAEAAAEGRPIKVEKKRSFCENIFLGQHVAPSRRAAKLFEDRILRDQYSSLYAMCEQRAYYWFIVDLMRKGAVSAIYMFGRNGRFDYQYILLVFFVFFAINHDIAQPYRGRAENLFAFLTLMFLIILVHTSTMANLGDGGGLISLSFMTMVSIVGLTFVMLGLAMFYNKRDMAAQAVAAERRKRRAQDHWGDVAKDMLGLDADDSTEEALRAAFKVFDAGSDDTIGDGTLTCTELMGLRDGQRKLYQTWVPNSARYVNPQDTNSAIIRNPNHGEVGWESTPSELEQSAQALCTCVHRPEHRIPKQDPLQLLMHEPNCDKCRLLKPKVAPGGLPATRRQELFENITDEECEEMIVEADINGDNRINFEEFVSVIFNSWERKQQTDKLADWVFTEFHRPVAADYANAPTKCCSKAVNAEWEPRLDICKPTKAKIYRQKDGSADVVVKPALWPRYKEHVLASMAELNPMIEDLDLFKGMLESVSMRNKYNDGWDEATHGERTDKEGKAVLDAHGNPQQVEYVQPKPFKVDLKTGQVTLLCDGRVLKGEAGKGGAYTFSKANKKWEKVMRDYKEGDLRASRRGSDAGVSSPTIDAEKPEPDAESQLVDAKPEAEPNTEPEPELAPAQVASESLQPDQEVDSVPRP